MKHLAELIRKGLSTKEVVEDKHICGAGVEGSKISANVTGLALIGKIGVDNAVELFDQAMEEDGGGLAEQRILNELSATPELLEAMVEAHFHGESAMEIAFRLEHDRFVVD